MYNIEIPDQVFHNLESHRVGRRIRRLPAVLRDDERSKHNYDPKVISFGPFHHGKPELHLGETFKHKALETFLSTCGKDRLFFHNTIMAAIDEIRSCYDQVPIDDTTLAEMMLLDGFFIISLMELLSNSETLINVLYGIGMAGFSYAVRDMFLLENQIPYIVIKLLMKLRYDDARKGEELLNIFLNFAAFQGHQNELETARNGDGDDETEPIHLLEAIRRILVSKPINNKRKKNSLPPKVREEVYLRTRLYTSRSVLDLKSKGISFNPSPTSFLKDVMFDSHFLFYGDLNLPARCISEKTIVLFANLMAYETAPDNATDYAVSSYVNLMKSLIHSAGDVKELREKRILVSNLGSDDEVFRVLKDLGTCGMENAGIFHDVKERIEEHYNSKAKTWMAELVHNYFESPWTAIALLAAILLLVLTFLQTYFTIHPSN